MTIGTSKSPNPRNRKGISVIKLKFLSVSSMNTLLAILKVTDARRDVILARGLYHRFPWRHLSPLRCKPMSNVTITTYLHKLTTPCQLYTPSILIYMSTAFKIGQPLTNITWPSQRLGRLCLSHRPKGQPRSTRDKFPIQPFFFLRPLSKTHETRQ